MIANKVAADTDGRRARGRNIRKTLHSSLEHPPHFSKLAKLPSYVFGHEWTNADMPGMY
jgi:hypothetical protein